MPAEPRRTSRKIANDEDIEIKRARGEISCAECRRLKLKCDKKLPCGSCVRRGCTTICPNGSLSAGQGTRFVLADTEQLHRKIAEMSERIRQLEDALAIFQAGISSERHPLLRDELLTVKFGPEVRRTVDDEHSRNVMSQTIDALGTLTIGEHGETKYIGRSGGSETLILAGCNGQATSADSSCPLEDPELDIPELDWESEKFSFIFPFSICSADFESFMDKLESHLPPQPRAWALCETYLEHFSWWFRPLKRDELINEVLTPIYKKISDPSKGGYQRKPDAENSRCPHLLAVLCMVLAAGALVDLTLPSCSVEAEKYYRLGRAALSLRSVFDSPELETVQALGLMAAYHSLCSSRYSLDSAWTLVSLASKLGQAIGLHRDSSAWKLDDKIVQRRRNLFWELFILEMMHSVALGRPPSLSLSHVDCQVPVDDEGTTNENGSISHSFWKWRFMYSQKVYSIAIDALLAAKAPSYEVVLDLDRKIRQTTLPPVKLYLKPDEDDYNNPSLCMKGWLMSQYRSISMLYIHRTFFAQALLDHPDNPLASPYAPSFLAANRCASVLIKSFIHHFERCPDLCGRFWGIWTHTFSAAIILGSTVYRSPSVSMAASALIELELVLELFARGAPHSKRARQGYVILRDLKAKADKSYQQFRNRHASPALDISFHIGPEAEISACRLAIFGGQTRVMTSKLLSRRRPTKQQSGSTSAHGSSSQSGSRFSSATGSPASTSADSPRDASPSASTPSDSGNVPQNVSDAFAEVHPSLVEYLSLFPTGSSIAVVDPPQGVPGLPGNGAPLDPRFPQGMEGINAMQPNTPQYPNFYGDFSIPHPNGNFLPSTADEPAVFDSPMNLQDLGFTEDVMMSEHWMNLMRETGILPSSGQFANGQGQPNGPNGAFVPPNMMF